MMERLGFVRKVGAGSTISISPSYRTFPSFLLEFLYICVLLVLGPVNYLLEYKTTQVLHYWHLLNFVNLICTRFYEDISDFLN